MNLRDLYSKNSNDNKPVISYEVYPPKDDIDGSKLECLFDELDILKKYNPSLISVTYGAGGSNQVQSIEIIERIKNILNITPMPHFTCVSTGFDNIKSYIDNIISLGVENILALRGDLPENGRTFDDFRHASDLVAYIKENTNLSVAVAGYPEVHKEALSEEKDLEYLKYKVDLGADVVYTQLFFNNEHYCRYLEKCRKIGINAHIIPGILPVISFQQLWKMIGLSQVDVPKKLFDDLEKHKEDKLYIKQYGIDYATKQCEELMNFGVDGFHFYTLNKAYSVAQILENLFN